MINCLSAMRDQEEPDCSELWETSLEEALIETWAIHIR